MPTVTSTSLWTRLPATAETLIDELDAIVPPASVEGPVADEGLRQLIFLAGRRDLVNQLIRIRDNERRRDGST